MSERTAPALTKLDALLPALRALPASKERDHLLEEAEALQRAVTAFHMEAIRFRMYNVERALKAAGASTGAAHGLFEQLRHELETAGFHTRSHTAP